MRLFTLVLWGCALLIGAPAFAQHSPTISRLRGSLYKVQDGRECTVFLVTPQGIVLGDPLSTPTAQWLKEEPVELYTDVNGVEREYRSRRTIALGDARVEVIHPSDAHAVDTTVIYFPAERLVFAGDYVPTVTSPIEFAPEAPKEVITWVRTVTTLDFDVLLSGSGACVYEAGSARIGSS